MFCFDICVKHVCLTMWYCAGFATLDSKPSDLLSACFALFAGLQPCLLALRCFACWELFNLLPSILLISIDWTFT